MPRPGGWSIWILVATCGSVCGPFSEAIKLGKVELGSWQRSWRVSSGTRLDASQTSLFLPTQIIIGRFQLKLLPDAFYSFFIVFIWKREVSERKYKAAVEYQRISKYLAESDFQKLFQQEHSVVFLNNQRKVQTLWYSLRTHMKTIVGIIITFFSLR